MKLLLFGANGQVGTQLRRSLPVHGDVVAATRSGRLPDGTHCIGADFDQPHVLAGLIDSVAPDVVVNAAAYTAVDKAEDDAEAAWRANAEAPLAIAEACARRRALLVHYSTDYVFDGQATRPYREDDPVGPLSVYGASKLAGEQAIRASGARHLIFRTAWVYGAQGRNFLTTMLRLAAERQELRVVADQFGSPTPAGVIADVSAQVLGQAPEESGTWHLTTEGHTSWHGFAEAIVALAHARGLVPRPPRVVPIDTSEYPTRATRPAWSVLDCHALDARFNLHRPSWQQGLEAVLGR
jgi:dTDP-4-dehydrorhamnose reductase